MSQMSKTQDLIYGNSREYSRLINGILAVEEHARDLARKLDACRDLAFTVGLSADDIKRELRAIVEADQ